MNDGLARGGRRLDAFRAALLVAFVFAVAHGVAGVGEDGLPGALQGVERRLLDAHYRFRRIADPPGPADPRLVLIGWDEAAEALEHTYPSQRHAWAALLERVAEGKPRLVFFDYRLSTPLLGEAVDSVDRLRRGLDEVGLRAEDRARLDEVEAAVAADRRIAAALAAVPSLLPFVCVDTMVPPEEGPFRSPAALDRAGAFEAAATPATRASTAPLRRVNRFSEPLPRFIAEARLAHTCEWPQPDGRLRTDAPVLSTIVGDRRVLLPSVSLTIARIAAGLPPEAITVARDAVNLGTTRIPLDAAGETLLGLSGPRGSFRTRGIQGTPVHYSASAVLTPDFVPDRLAGRIVLIGPTSQTRDVKVTPFGVNTPGIEKIAMQVDALLSGKRLVARPAWAARWGFLLTALVGVLAAAAGARLPFAVAAGSIVPGTLALPLAGAVAFTWGGIWIDTGFAGIAWGATVMAATLLRYAEEAGTRRFLEDAFGKYLAPEMVKTLLRDHKALALSGEEREMTVLFADLRGFTTFAEKSTPGEVVALLNEHLTAMSDAIQRHGGTVDKFVGDAVMAFWNAPLSDPDHARHACEAAREMLRVLDATNEKRIAAGRPMLDIGIGINTGPAVVGNMGSSSRFNYTVIGDSVNLASRLEGVTKELHVRIIVGPGTWASVAAALRFVALGAVRVKGKAEPVEVYGLDESATSPVAEIVASNRPR